MLKGIFERSSRQQWCAMSDPQYDAFLKACLPLEKPLVWPPYTIPMKFSTIAEMQNSDYRCLQPDGQPWPRPDIVGVAAVDEAIAGTLSYIEGDKFAPLWLPPGPAP
jgi:hypothetical protein